MLQVWWGCFGFVGYMRLASHMQSYFMPARINSSTNIYEWIGAQFRRIEHWICSLSTFS